MADNTVLPPGGGGDTIATDDVAGVKHQRVIIEYGPDGAPVQVNTGASALPIQDGGNSITVDGAVSLAAAIPAGTNNIGDVDVLTVPAPLSTTGNGLAATALRVTVASDSTGQVAITLGKIHATIGLAP